MNNYLSRFEYSIIEERDFPNAWKGKNNLIAFERFLQSSWDQRMSLYDDGEESKKQQFLEFDHRNKIKTKNYIGTIIFNRERLDIYPKIYDEYNYIPTISDLILDLTTWLHYCDKARYPFINIPSSFSGKDDTFEIFAAVYVQYVENALKSHTYMNYQDIRETGTNIKGKIDFTDYAVRKIASGQHHVLDYSYSAFVFDNDVNRIIKATCKIINRITKNETTKSIIRKIMQKLEEVSDEICSPGDCDKARIIEQKSCYKAIMQMSKMFLMNKTSSGIQGEVDAFCFLFPAELLFEGFIGGIVKEMYHQYATVRLQSEKHSHYLAETYKNNKLVGPAFKLKEDIIIEVDPDFNIVLDTKYKIIKPLSEVTSFKKLGIDDTDMKQMVTYAIENDAIDLYLIYPLKKKEILDKDDVFYKIKTNIKDIHQEIDVHVLRVPFSVCEDKDKKLSDLNKALWKILGDYIESLRRI